MIDFVTVSMNKRGVSLSISFYKRFKLKTFQHDHLTKKAPSAYSVKYIDSDREQFLLFLNIQKMICRFLECEQCSVSLALANNTRSFAKTN